MGYSKSNILVLFAHPAPQRSCLNFQLFESTRPIEGVTACDLYGRYPDFHIDVETEHQQLDQHRALVFQFPLYWNAPPALLKHWQDTVLCYGYAFGQGISALAGKRFVCAITTGANQDQFVSKNRPHELELLLSPLKLMASQNDMIYQPPFIMFNAEGADPTEKQFHIKGYELFLRYLRDNPVFFDQFEHQGYLTAQDLRPSSERSNDD